jgi:hypothetical protein
LFPTFARSLAMVARRSRRQGRCAPCDGCAAACCAVAAAERSVAAYFIPTTRMTSLRRLVRLVIHGPGKHAPWAEPPAPAARGAAKAVEVTKDGLSVCVTWERAKYRGQGLHVYRVAVSRWYQDRDGVWRNTQNLHAEDIACLPSMMTSAPVLLTEKAPPSQCTSFPLLI